MGVREFIGKVLGGKKPESTGPVSTVPTENNVEVDKVRLATMKADQDALDAKAKFVFPNNLDMQEQMRAQTPGATQRQSPDATDSLVAEINKVVPGIPVSEPTATEAPKPPATAPSTPVDKAA